MGRMTSAHSNHQHPPLNFCSLYVCVYVRVCVCVCQWVGVSVGGGVRLCFGHKKRLKLEWPMLEIVKNGFFKAKKSA